MSGPEGKMTMQRFHDLCSWELDDAIQRNATDPAHLYPHYENPAGLRMAYLPGGLEVEFSDYTESDDEEEIKIITIDWSRNPPHVTEDRVGGAHANTLTVAQRKHNAIATRLVKYTLPSLVR